MHHPEQPTSPPVLIIVMGVSGSGKSSVARLLAENYGYRYLDADDFHSEEAKAQMAAGTPLTDEMRIPWVNNISAYLTDCAHSGVSCTLAFSGLRQAHRERLRRLPFNVIFIYLNGSKETISRRMGSREDHFMPTSLLDSQFASMEDSSAEADVLPVDITPPLEQVISECRSRIDEHLHHH